MTTEITLRRNKSQPLTFNEVDNNFENLKATADAAATGSGLAALTAEVNAIDSSLTTLTGRVDTIEGDYTTTAESTAIADAAVAAHVALPDPHTQYLTDAESVSYAATKAAADSLASGLGDGATVIVDRDETQSGLKIRYTVLSNSLVSPVVNGAIFDSPDILIAHDGVTFAEGDYLRAGSYSYVVAASGATDHHLTIANGNKLYVLVAADGAYHTAALGSPSGTDDTAKLTALLATAEDGKLVFDYHVSPYSSGNLVPPANCHIVLMPGVVLTGIAGGSRNFQLQKENILLEGYGATIQRHVGQTSHPVYINSSTINHAKNIIVRGLTIVGNGASGTGGTGENDCIYIGGSPQGISGDPLLDSIPENVLIEDCKLFYPRRNVISVVAGSRVVIRNNLLDGAGAVILQCGVDVEANKFMTDGSQPVNNVLVEGNEFRNCQKWGLISVFGDVDSRNNTFYPTGTAKAIGIGAGGAQFNDNVYRDGDRLGILAFDSGTGNITVRGPSQATLHELGIHVGMWIQGTIKSGSGGAWPAGMASPFRYAISWISADGTQIRVATRYLFGEITSFGGAHSGTIDEDPTVSALQFYVFRPGVASTLTSDNDVIYGDTTLSLIDLSTFYKTKISNSRCYQAGTGSCINAIYGFKPIFEGNETVGGIRGINADANTLPVSVRNRVERSTVDGIVLGGYGAYSRDDTVYLSSADGIVVEEGAAQRVIGATVYNDSVTTTARGIYVSGVNALVKDCNCLGAGGSNTTSLAVVGAGSRLVDCIQKDGTYR